MINTLFSLFRAFEYSVVCLLYFTQMLCRQAGHSKQFISRLSIKVRWNLIGTLRYLQWSFLYIFTFASSACLLFLPIERGVQKVKLWIIQCSWSWSRPLSLLKAGGVRIAHILPSSGSFLLKPKVSFFFFVWLIRLVGLCLFLPLWLHNNL